MWSPYELSELDIELAGKWRDISKELRIDCVAPFEIATEQGTFKYAALIKGFGFGGSHGCLFRAVPEEFTPEQNGAIWDAAIDEGFAIQNLSAYGVEILDVESAKESYLEYMEYLGDNEHKPAWYTGKHVGKM